MYLHHVAQELSARKRALCQLIEWFEFLNCKKRWQWSSVQKYTTWILELRLAPQKSLDYRPHVIEA